MLRDSLPCADELFSLLGEDEELFAELGDLVFSLGTLMSVENSQPWLYAFIDTVGSGPDNDAQEFINSMIAFAKLAYDPENEAPDEIFPILKEILNILEPLQEPPLVMDSNGEFHEEGYEE